ncbi:myosin heavy chain, clone 203-like isoform X1 [Watersipora subatra]|uniref:myosin heavy chain, clone 203-like isoform X1 n=1 Tax=Watersipora subatra TaxID=2589382 RepID=UPI00355B2B55
MPIDREITKPMLGDNQEPTALTWKSTLRTPTESPRGPHQSRSRTRSAGMTQSLRSRTPSPAMKSLSKDNNLRKSSSGKLGTSFGNSTDLGRIEGDYVKNLQQQIYFLELEANYLREQAKKATEMHPKMTAEAERMLTKLRVLQADSDSLQLELRRREDSLELANDEKYKILARLSQEENEKERMREMLQDELAEVKAERDRITLENVRLDNQIDRLRAENDNSSAKLRESQHIISLVKDQLKDASENQRLTQFSLEETRNKCIEAQNRADKVEEHYLNTTQVAHEAQINNYKDEARVLKLQLKDHERQVHDERYLKNKIQDENDQLAKTNSLLRKQIDDLESQVVREQQTKNDLEVSQSEDLIKISMMSDKETELKLTLRSLQKELANERERCNRFLTELKINEQEKSQLESVNNAVKMELTGSETRTTILEKDNASLRMDKEILTDHVADLQKQLAAKEGSLYESKQQIRELVSDLSLAEADREEEESAQTQKWREFENLADGMKKLSRTMVRTTTSSKGLRNSSKFS